MSNDRRKQALLLDADAVVEMKAEARRQGCSLSHLAQTAWRLAADTLRRIPSTPKEEITC